MKEFKVGDKVYFPYYGTDIFEVKPNEFNENLEKYPLMIGSKTFTIHGKIFDQSCLQDIFHATPENHELLEKLYGLEFEKPPVKPTSKEIILAMLARGDKCVPCWASDHRENPGAESAWACIVGCSDGCYPFALSNGGGWKYATPFDPKTGEPITELPT